MNRVEMTSYDAAREAFVWQVPDTFNFGGDVVDVWAQERPHHLALIWTDEAGAERRFTYSEMRAATSRMANALAAVGIEKGDFVIVMLPRIPEWQIAMVGCLKLGAVPIPCIDMLTERDIAYRLENSGAAGAITTAPNIGKFARGGSLRARFTIGAEGDGWQDLSAALEGASDEFEPVEMAAEEPAIMYYTSGSTGYPKGVLHASRALFAWRVSAWYWLDLRADDVMWCTADTGWSKAGTSILFGPWSCGSTVLFHDGRFDAERRFDLLKRYRVSVFCAAATELRRLIQIDPGKRDLGALRLTVSAGESVNPEIVRRWTALTGSPLLDGYGQTETLMTVLNYPAMPVKPGSMGRPLPGTEVAVLSEYGRHCPPGEVGRLAVGARNPQLLLRYWRDPERTRDARVTEGGEDWFLTGDLARADEEGYLYYQGRSDDVINSAGYRIGPVEVENVLMEHDAVVECAVVASPHEERGEVVKAFIVLSAQYTPGEALVAELQNHVKRLTGPYKYPRRIAFVDDLPKTASGKVQRNLLREREFSR